MMKMRNTMMKIRTTVTVKALQAKRKFMEPSGCLLYTSPSPRDMRRSRMPSSA